jgi:hypothetical protein
MNSKIVQFSIVLLLMFFAFSCGRAKTPPHVQTSYDELIEQTESAPPEVQMGKLHAFAQRYDRYKISRTAQERIDDLKSEVEARLDKAQALAEAGQVDAAEKIAGAVAEAAAGTETGKLAKKFLTVELPLRKAKAAAEQGRFAEAADQIESLDHGTMNLAEKTAAKASAAALKSAQAAMSAAGDEQFAADCRYLHILLVEYQANNGTYPSSLSSGTVASLHATEGKALIHAFSAINKYKADADSFSLVAVSPDGKTSLSISEAGILRN